MTVEDDKAQLPVMGIYDELTLRKVFSSLLCT